MNLERVSGVEYNPALEIEPIETSEIALKLPAIGGTEIVLQRNAKDDRRIESRDLGAIIPEQLESAKDGAKEKFANLFSDLSEEEIASLSIVVVASEAELITETGITSSHRRAYETAVAILAGIKEAMPDDMSREQLFNRDDESGEAQPFRVSELTDLKMMSDSQEFVQFLIKKYGTGRDFWVAFESDAEKQTREEMGAEGPHEIAERMDKIVSMMILAAREYHRANPGRRMIVWADSHYDSISPFIKSKIAGLEGDNFEHSYYPVDYGAGIVINVSPDQKVETEIKGQKIELKANLPE